MPRQLTPQHEALIERIIVSGRYTDPDEIITEALGQLEARERNLSELRAKLQVGLDELDRGESFELTDELWDEIERESEEAYLRGEKPDPDVCP